MTNLKLIISLASVLLAVGVIAGAFGAHALKNTLSPERMETWQTAVQYHVWHALGLLLIALIASHFQIDIRWVSILLLGGILIFSGSLYALCLSGISWLGAITPIGGAAFIAGWLLLAYKALK